MSEALKPAEMPRRAFVAAGAALAATACGSETQSGPVEIVERDVEIRTPDGVADAAFVHPATGAHPAVLVWTDAFGLRPAVRELAQRLAREGYCVLAPNPFYRISKAPQFSDVSSFNFANPEDRAKIGPLMASIAAAGAAERDAQAFVAWLDAQPQVDKSKKMGTQGYCMGGALVFRTAAALPERVGAGASFHGGGLTTQNPDSPHLLIPKMKARLLVAIAQNDDQQQPESKDILRKAFADAGVQAEVEVFPALHGWCMRDMPVQEGKPIYHQAEAERAWAKLLELYKTALA
jgi:carboxymethylenebutenolidase